MKYKGFREDTLLSAFHEFEALGLSPNEAYAILDLAGAKWRAVQIREGRSQEYYDEEDGIVFQKATVAIMQSTMPVAQHPALLCHSSQIERFMLVALTISINKLFTRGTKTIKQWLGAGDIETRKIILAFALGASIIVEPKAIDVLINSIVRLRYGVVYDMGRDISDSIIKVIEKIGNSGYLYLNPIEDAIE